MEEILLYLGVLLIVLGYFLILFLYFKYSKKVNNKTGFDNCFKILKEDNNIKIIEGKNLVFSNYDASRNVIRLSSRNYNSSDLFTLFITSLLSGYALNYKNKSLNILNKIFKKYRFISFSSVITIFVSFMIYGVMDAKIGILLLLIVVFYQYLFLDYMSSSSWIVKNTIKDKDVIKIINVNIKANMLFMFASILELVRFIMIIIFN